MHKHRQRSVQQKSDHQFKQSSQTVHVYEAEKKSAHPYNVDFNAYCLLDAGRHEYLLGVGGVDRRTEGRAAPIARAHSLQ